MHKTLSAALALALVSGPVTAQQPAALTLDQKTLVRCSAAFALAANKQETGDRSLGEIPELRARGQEYFVRAMAQIMDAKSLDRDGITNLLKAEVAELSAGDTLAKAMPPCLLSLEASGL
ncbi:hypothetical protein [Tsuneonella sp. HG222]